MPLALRVEVKPSNYFFAALISVVLIVLCAILYAQLLWPLRVLLASIVLGYAGYCWRVQMRQRGVLQWRSVWFWRGTDGVERALRLRHSTVWPALTVLSFQDVERKHSFVLTLCADSLCTDDARRLRVYLNHFPVFETAEVDA